MLQSPTLFWLDAHYSGGPLRGALSAHGCTDRPILDELEQILDESYNGHVIIIIDDARLFGTDPAYPTLETLKAPVQSKGHTVEIVIEDDSIRIQPLRGARLSSNGSANER